jgi:tetratricopeptide (TPR) repeat protein
MRMLILHIVMFLLSLWEGYAQNVDSLRLALKNAKHDTVKCRILSLLAETASDEEWPGFNEQLRQIAEERIKSNSPRDSLYKIYAGFLASAFNNIGYLANQEGDISKALNYYGKSLKITEEIADKQGIAGVLNNLGFICNSQGDIPKALDYYNRSLKLMEEIGDKENIAVLLNNIGLIFNSQGEFSLAMDYYNRSLKIKIEVGNKDEIAYSLNNIGHIYQQKNELSTAYDYLLRCLKIYEESGNIKGIGFSMSNLGVISFKMNNIPEALDYFRKSLKIRKETGEMIGLASVFNYLGEVYLLRKKYSLAYAYSDSSLSLSKKLGFPIEIRTAEQTLSKIESARGNFKEALIHFEQFIIYRDSISNAENKKASIKSQLKYEYEKQAAQDSVKNAEKIVQQSIIHEEAIKQQRLYTYGGGIGFGLMLIIAGISFRAFRNKQKANLIINAQKHLVEEQKKMVEEKQKEILDSIYYARRIQRALMSSEKHIEKNLYKLQKKN